MAVCAQLFVCNHLTIPAGFAVRTLECMWLEVMHRDGGP